MSWTLRSATPTPSGVVPFRRQADDTTTTTGLPPATIEERLAALELEVARLRTLVASVLGLPESGIVDLGQVTDGNY
jgi:hypothetical protein